MTDNTRKAENGLQAARVAIVGAGAAGLVAAREFRRAGHAVQVFEQQSDIGGVWVPDDGELAGPGPKGVKVHTSMYESLRVNLPRELMSFSDFPFVPDFMQGRSVDARRFPHHTEVRQYLEAFADRYKLRDAVHLNTRVTRVAPTPPPDGGGTTWQVDTVSASSGTAAQGAPELGAAETREYDAVVICNGHYTVPRMPDIEGLDSFPGRVEHSHMYRRPDVYSGERVLIVGAFATGEDLAWDIAPFAKSVTMSATSWMQPHYSEQKELFGAHGNMLRRPWVTKMNSDGSVEFEGGAREAAIDAVLICTGYQYTFPFLEDGIVDVVDSHVQPLYKHLLHPRYGASLAFIGLGYKNVPFPQCEVQAKYVAALLSGEAETPSQEAMEDWVQRESGLLKEKGIPDRHVHCMALSQFPYNDELAAKCGGSKTPAWRLSLVMHTMELWGKYSAIQYRDEWEDEEALSSTYAAFEAIRRAQ